MVLILSYGNGALERGFSVNKECVTQNQLGESLIAQRCIYDGSTMKSLESFSIPITLIHKFRNVHIVYKRLLKIQIELTQKKSKEI